MTPSTASLHLVPDLDDETTLIPLPPIPGDEDHVDDQADATIPVPVAEVAVDIEGLDERTLVDDDGTPVLVATPATYTDEATSGRDLGPIVAPWARSARGIADRVADRVSIIAKWCLFHGLRLPLYWLRLAIRSPRGLGRTLVALWLWVVDPRGREERDALRVALKSNSSSSASLTKAIESHRNGVRGRLLALAMGLLVVPVALIAALVTVAVLFGPIVALLAIVASWAGTIAGLGYVGRPLDKPVSAWAVSKMDTPRITPDLLVTALKLCGVPDLRKAIDVDGTRAVRFLTPVARTKNAGGGGYHVDVELPAGVEAGEVVDRRTKLASGLRRHESCVWPAPDPHRHAGCLSLYVADKPLSQAGAVPWALLKSGTTDVFRPEPIGVDERGEVVKMTLMWGSGAIGAVPRIGKSYSLRVLNGIAGLDPSVEIHFYDWKGGGDHDEVALVAHTFISGAEEQHFAAALADLDDLIARMNARYARLAEIKRQDPSLVPEKKITRQLANRRDLDLWPIYVAMDEAHEPFTNGKKLREEFEGKLAKLERKGPAVGIMVWKATQRTDDPSIPSTLMAIASKRVALRLMDANSNNMILGAGMYARGYRATAFSMSDKGVSWVIGDADDPQLCRWPKIDTEPAERLFERARAVRESRGWLTGMAAGEEPTAEVDDTDSMVEHVYTVWPTGPKGDLLPREHCSRLAELLAEALPATYEGVTGEQVTLGLKALGVPARKGKVRGVSSTAITYAELDAVFIARRSDDDLDDQADTDDEDQADDDLDEVGAPWLDDDLAGELVAD